MIAVMSNEACTPFSKKVNNIPIYPLKQYSRLDIPVSSHGDMLLCIIDDTVFCYNDYYYDNVETFVEIEKQGKKIKFVSKECSSKYPNDIALNVLIMGKTIFCNTENTAPEITEYALQNGYEVINVKQGYSACSTLVIDEDLAITGDIGMKKAIESASKKAFLVDNSKIILHGYNCGFIGGAGAMIDKKLYFFGPTSFFENYPEIMDFFAIEGIEIISIIPDQVYDFGGIKLI